jgi:hypothetical protein
MVSYFMAYASYVLHWHIPGVRFIIADKPIQFVDTISPRQLRLQMDSQTQYNMSAPMQYMPAPGQYVAAPVQQVQQMQYVALPPAAPMQYVAPPMQNTGLPMQYGAQQVQQGGGSVQYIIKESMPGWDAAPFGMQMQQPSSYVTAPMMMAGGQGNYSNGISMENMYMR